VIVNMGLAGVLAVEVLVGHVRVPQRRMVVLMSVRGAEVLEASGHLVVVVRYVEMPVVVHQPLVVVFLPAGRGSILGHGYSFRRAACTLPVTYYPAQVAKTRTASFATYLIRFTLAKAGNRWTMSTKAPARRPVSSLCQH
jgi:hypothetical protein